MPFMLARFVELRPYLYHTTSLANLALILKGLQLKSAATLIQESGRFALLRERRRDAVSLPLHKGTVTLTSQQPLSDGHCDMKGDPEAFANLVQQLNEHVFFWPGTERQMFGAGGGHSKSATGPNSPVTMRFATAELFGANASEALFSAAVIQARQGGTRVWWRTVARQSSLERTAFPGRPQTSSRLSFVV